MNRPPDDDPETQRLDALIARAVEGALSESEREELALYAEHDPGVESRLRTAEEQGRLARGWLERVRRDGELAMIETSSRVRIERGVGLALLVAGYALTFLTPALGAGAMGAGVLMLLYTFVRVRLASHGKDPYKDVIR
jgi:hypothetical protein